MSSSAKLSTLPRVLGIRMWPVTNLLTSWLLVASALADDVLVSRRYAETRLHKRAAEAEQETFNITFFHINDVHAHLDEFKSSGADCEEPEDVCYGGYSRVKTFLDANRPNKTNTLFLDAGDEFQGTLFYNFYRGDIST